jgi:hypothetical protein
MRVSDHDTGSTLDIGTRRRLRAWLTRRRTGIALLVLLAFLALYYPVGMAVMHTIDDDPVFFASIDVPTGRSRAVALAAALVDREVNRHPWTANDPFFLPSAALDNMPNFQQGILAGLARFALETRDQLGRTRGSSHVDKDLERAASLLQYSGTVWVWDPSVSWLPTASSEAQYRSAIEALVRYNERLERGQAVFDRRADNLLGTLERIAADLGSASAVADERITEGAPILFDFISDDIFYRNKGMLYAYYMVLRELGRDYKDLITERRLDAPWQQMIHSFEEAATLQPIVVVNGSPESQVLPSHLAAQGFYLLRARVQVREIENILLK